MQRFRHRALLVALACLALPAGAGAQAFTLAAGARVYDEADGGSTLTAALRSEFPVGDRLILEFASSIADHPDGVVRSTASVFEAQIQLPVPLGDVLVPYFGAGAGVGWTRTLGGDDNALEPVVSLSVGTRAAITEELGVVLEARARGIGAEFAGSHLDLTVGLRYRLLPRDRPRFRGAP